MSSLPSQPAAVAADVLALRAPFSPAEIRWKPSAFSQDGSRALALAYVEARTVQDRLDSVVGPGNWRDTYRILDGLAGGQEQPVCVECGLALRLNREWLVKCDVGQGKDLKAAYSDALKRAGVKWGIGRYLHALPAVWAEYDAARQCFVDEPALAAVLTQAPGGDADGSDESQPPAPPPRNASEARASDDSEPTQRGGFGDFLVRGRRGMVKLSQLNGDQIDWLVNNADSADTRGAAIAYRDELITLGQWQKEVA